jgi:glycosyltransferase involved in cell wall biosynthesis
VGDGAERKALEEFVAATPGLRGHVRFLGQRSDIPEFLSAIDTYVLPSLCEGISNSLLEAMATGLPVVASKVGGNPEVIVEGETGLLFPTGNHRELAAQLVLLYQDFEFRARLARAAVQRVREQFSLEHMVRQYEEMYAGIASGRAAEPYMEKALSLKADI